MAEDPDCSVSLSSLICKENITHLDDNDDDSRFEITHLTEARIETVDWLSCARSDSIRWILRMKAWFVFGSETAYLAVFYFDRFLARRAITQEGKSWALRLLSVACLSLAAKMEELRSPALSEFQIEEDYYFENATVQRMELLVLNTLEWRMSSVTPFEYLGYFASKFQSDDRLEDLVSRSIGFIFAIIKVMNLVDSLPFTIAAAAILAASGQVLTKKLVESKISAISLTESLETEQVFACYSVMIQELEKDKLKSMEVLVSSDRSANCASLNSSVGVIESTRFTCSSSKRRRLL